MAEGHRKKGGRSERPTSEKPNVTPPSRHPYKKSDFQQLKELLNSFSIEHQNVRLKNGVGIDIKQGDGKVKGYYGFYSTYKFDLEGRFIEVELLE